jgi:serine/threonine-protein kinase HipA
MRGEHATTVNGKGRDIGLEDLLALGENAGLSKSICRDIAAEVQEKIAETLRKQIFHRDF